MCASCNETEIVNKWNAIIVLFKTTLWTLKQNVSSSVLAVGFTRWVLRFLNAVIVYGFGYYYYYFCYSASASRQSSADTLTRCFDGEKILLPSRNDSLSDSDRSTSSECSDSSLSDRTQKIASCNRSRTSSLIGGGLAGNDLRRPFLAFRFFFRSTFSEVLFAPIALTTTSLSRAEPNLYVHSLADKCHVSRLDIIISQKNPYEFQNDHQRTLNNTTSANSCHNNNNNTHFGNIFEASCNVWQSIIDRAACCCLY